MKVMDRREAIVSVDASLKERLRNRRDEGSAERWGSPVQTVLRPT